MKIENVFKLHRWAINKFLTIILAIQLSLLGIVILEYLGFSVPILRALIGFIYLTFVPGTLILRILKLNKISDIESILYTVGLSLSFLMILGFLMNTIYPIFNIIKPLSLNSIFITLTIIVSFLSILSYFRDDGHNFNDYLKIVNFRFIAFLIIIPFLIVIGSYLMNFYDIYILTLMLLVVISLISIAVLSNSLKTCVYPLTIFIIAISLLYHNSLVSLYVWGWDINSELYFANEVINNAFWFSDAGSPVNSMLSIVMLVPIYSAICKISSEWIFKIIYPFLFSLVPLGLYYITKRFTSSKIAFFSTFYFMAVYMFYCDMVQLARQQIAELFFILLILIMINNEINGAKRSILFIIFGTSIIFSHYGLSYIYMFYILSAIIILYLINIYPIKNIRFFNRYKRLIHFNLSDSTLTTNFTLILFVFGISWYIYTSSSTSFVTVVTIINQMFGSIFTEFFNPNSVQGLSIVASTEISPFHQITKYLFLFSQFLIFIGITTIFSEKSNFSIEYKILSFLSFLLAVFGLLIPYLSSSLQTSRFYQITLLLLSPFVVLGFINLLNIINKLARVKIHKNTVFKLTAIFLSIFLLFNSGVIYKITDEVTPSMSLIALDRFDYPVFNTQEVNGANWLSKYHKTNQIYSDAYRSLLLNGYFGDRVPKKIFTEYQSSIESPIIYLGTYNIETNKVAYRGFQESSFGNIKYAKIQNLQNGNKIYDNQGSQIILFEKTYDPSLIYLDIDKNVKI